VSGSFVSSAISLSVSISDSKVERLQDKEKRDISPDYFNSNRKRKVRKYAQVEKVLYLR
jgi:hypothetical protein